MFGRFLEFINRVKAALTAGVKLKKKDTDMLLDILNTFYKRERIYLYAILSLLGRKKPKKSEIEKFEKIVDNATDNILKGKAPFDEKERAVVIAFFEEIGLGRKQAIHFMNDFTAARGDMLKDGISNLNHIVNESKEKDREKLA